VLLVHERGAILASFTEKSDDFAQTFVASGTFGFIPGHPSASTQPLYGFFLVPIYWIAGRHWWSVGGAQILVAVAVALLVYEIGRRILSRSAGLLAALATTLHPYLVWHDIHVNREILDQLLGAAMVLLALLAARRGSLWLAAALGAVAGLAILSNTRLALLPLVLAGYLLWRLGRAAVVPAVLVLAVAAITVAPWVVRNRVQVGCWSITTDARALWKANTMQTYDILARGGWIDDVPPLPGAPRYTPEMQGAKWKVDHVLLPVDECAQQRFYEAKVEDFWREHPGEKARLAGQATAMLWSPVARSDAAGASEGGGSLARRLVEPVYMGIVYALAAVGLFLVPRALGVLAVSFLAYETLAAAVFAGTTRYRVPWDFLLMLLAAAAVTRLPLLRRPSSQER
jgi:4-amino-4-deoxy-L-arabinose transferase-like glycosyltransferase